MFGQLEQVQVLQVEEMIDLGLNQIKFKQISYCQLRKISRKHSMT